MQDDKLLPHAMEYTISMMKPTAISINNFILITLNTNYFNKNSTMNKVQGNKVIFEN